VKLTKSPPLKTRRRSPPLQFQIWAWTAGRPWGRRKGAKHAIVVAIVFVSTKNEQESEEREEAHRDNYA
jgi:hypothetical protein